MKRQIFDYEKPHVIGGEKKEKRRNRQSINLKRIVFFAFITALFAASVIFGLVLYGPFSFKLKKTDYYMLFLSRTTTVFAAEAAKQEVAAAGGAGYIINDGDFLVTAFVYAGQSDAENVRQRMLADYPDAQVVPYSFGKTKVKRFDSRPDERQLKNLLDYPFELINTIIDFVYSLDSFQSTESGVMLQLEQLKDSLKNKSEDAVILATKYQHIKATKLTVDFYDEFYQSLSLINILTQSETKLTHKLKSFACETVHKVYLLRSKLELL